MLLTQKVAGFLWLNSIFVSFIILGNSLCSVGNFSIPTQRKLTFLESHIGIRLVFWNERCSWFLCCFDTMLRLISPYLGCNKLAIKFKIVDFTPIGLTTTSPLLNRKLTDFKRFKPLRYFFQVDNFYMTNPKKFIGYLLILTFISWQRESKLFH